MRLASHSHNNPVLVVHVSLASYLVRLGRSISWSRTMTYEEFKNKPITAHDLKMVELHEGGRKRRPVIVEDDDGETWTPVRKLVYWTGKYWSENFLDRLRSLDWKPENLPHGMGFGTPEIKGVLECKFVCMEGDVADFRWICCMESIRK